MGVDLHILNLELNVYTNRVKSKIERKISLFQKTKMVYVKGTLLVVFSSVLLVHSQLVNLRG